MEEDFLNYSPTVMFRGTPCIFIDLKDLKIFINIVEQIVKL